MHPSYAEDMQGVLSGKHASDRTEETQRSKMGMTYPQFVESLSLLAVYAAERLRFLYPDIAGTNPKNATPDAATPKADREASSRVHASTRRNDRSTVDKHDSQRMPGADSRKDARSRPGDLAINMAVRALPAVPLVPGARCVDQAKIPTSKAASAWARHRDCSICIFGCAQSFRARPTASFDNAFHRAPLVGLCVWTPFVLL